MHRDKRSLGSYYTTVNPFSLTAFQEWMKEVNVNGPWLEPFAGTGNIPKMLASIGIKPTWDLFDIDTSLTDVELRDTLNDFPEGYDVAISNPPYLSYHFAKRKGLAVSKKDFRGYQSLYLVALEKCLEHCAYVGLIIPESFLTTGLFRDRMQHFISLPFQMFDETEMPVALALFGPQGTRDFTVWSGHELIGNFLQLPPIPPSTIHGSEFKFNIPHGKIGLKAIDGNLGPSIKFVPAEEIPVGKVKNSARLLTRIHYSGDLDVDQLMENANAFLDIWRESTCDIHLTAFKGVRKDGKYRRRLDYQNARNILGNAVEMVGNQRLIF